MIHLSFAGGKVDNRAQLEEHIREKLVGVRDKLQLVCEPHVDNAIFFSRIIKAARNHYQQKVVILVDEYDKPVLDAIDTPHVRTEIHRGLGNLYSVIKEHDADLRFVFFTGISQLSEQRSFDQF